MIKKTLRNFTYLVCAIAINNINLALAHEADSTDVSIRSRDGEHKKGLISITSLPADESVVFTIKDKQGYVLHREVVDQPEVYAKQYDFSALPNGEYRAEWQTDHGTITEFFTLQAGQRMPLYFKPAIQEEPGLIKVAFMNRIDTPVSLKLYDERGEVLYEEKVSSQQTYAKGLDVSKLKAGQYSLSVLGHNYVYSKNIQIK